MGKKLPALTVSESEAEHRPLNSIAANLGQHWSIVGMTGSGKSYFGVSLLEYLRRQYPRVPRYFLDSTWDDKNLSLIPYPRVIEGDKPPDAIHDSTYTQVWRPIRDDLETYDAWMKKILYARKACIVVLDDIASFTKGGRVDLDGHMMLMKQGRKHGITVINGSQQISHVTSSVFQMMTYFVQFLLLQDVYEWSAARRYLNIVKEEQRMPSAKYGFFMRRMDGNFPMKEYRSLHELFGRHFHVNSH